MRMWKTEINKNDIERAVEKGIGERVTVHIGKSDDGETEQLRIVIVSNKEELLRWNMVKGDIMKKVVCILIEDSYRAYSEFKILTNRIKELEEQVSKKKKK